MTTTTRHRCVPKQTKREFICLSRRRHEQCSAYPRTPSMSVLPNPTFPSGVKAGVVVPPVQRQA